MQTGQHLRQTLVVAGQTPEARHAGEAAADHPLEQQQHEGEPGVGQPADFQSHALRPNAGSRLLSDVARRGASRLLRPCQRFIEKWLPGRHVLYESATWPYAVHIATEKVLRLDGSVVGYVQVLIACRTRWPDAHARLPIL